MVISQRIGDCCTHSIPLRHNGKPFAPGTAWNLIWTLKSDPDTQTDDQAAIQKTTVGGLGIAVSGSLALVSLVHVDTAGGTVDEVVIPPLDPGTYYWDVKAQRVDAPNDVRTVASGTLPLTREVTRSTEVSIPIYTTNPPVPLTDIAAEIGAADTRTLDGAEEVGLNVGGVLKKSLLSAVKTWVLTGISNAWADITGKPSTFPPSSHTHVSADVTDATSSATANMIVKRASAGSATNFERITVSTTAPGQSAIDASATQGDAITGTGTGYSRGIYGTSTHSAGVVGFSNNSEGLAGSTENGNYHARFGGDTGNDRSFIARLLGAFGWWRGAYTLMVSAADTLTANRVQRFQDKDGTIALTSDIPAIGTTAGTVAAGDHTHTGVYQPAGTYATGGGTATGTNTGDQDLSGLCVKANNLSDLADAATARGNLNIPHRRSLLDGGLFTPFRLMLDANRSTGFKNVGDSLGNGTDEFVHLFAQHVAAKYPNHRVVHRILTTNADPALGTWTDTVVQAANGERYLNFTFQRISQRCNTANGLSATGTGTLTLTVTASGMTNSPKAVTVAIVSGDTNYQLAEKMRVALAADADVSAHCDVEASLDRVLLTKKAMAAHDSTFNIATSSTGLGITNDSASDIGTYGAYWSNEECPFPSGDFEIEAKIRVTSTSLTNGVLLGWWGSTSPELSRSFKLSLGANSKLDIGYYDSAGTFRNSATADLSASLPANGTDWWLKASVDVDNGAGGTTTTFYKSTDGATWTLLTTLTITGVGIFYQTISGFSVGETLYGVRVYQMRVRNGIGGPIVNNTAIDSCSLGAPSTFLEFGGSPQIIIENYAHSGATTGQLLGHITGVKQYETATASGTISGSGDATVTVTGAGITGSPLALNVAVTSGDTAAVWGNKIKVALLATPAITALYDVLGYNASIALKRKTAAANDTTLNIALANGTCTGITAAPTSTNTTTGLAPWPDKWMTNNNDAFIIYSGGMNDMGAIPYINGKAWTDAVAEIVAKLKSISPQATPILLGTNPSVIVPASNATPFSAWFRDQHPMRMARGAALAKSNNWGYMDVWTAFNDDGRALDALIPDGTHGSSAASTEIFAPVLTKAFDAE